jgi:hypothetical protein
MSYDQSDADRDEMYERLSEELYPQHRDQAVVEFTSERLRSFYVANSLVMQPAIKAIQEGQHLLRNGHWSAALVFFVTAIEVLLKATLLKPVVHGLVHSEGLANAVVEQALGQTGFDRYTGLLAKLFTELIDMDIRSVKIAGSAQKLLEECTALQSERNAIVHRGASSNEERAKRARRVASAVLDLIVHPMLLHLDLHAAENGEICRIES